MYIRRNIKWNVVLRFAWAYLLFFAFWAALVTQVYHHFDHHGKIISIPFQPIATIGIAVAFYIGFKNNASYDRFWEARKIWGGIVNYSRTWGNQVMSFVTKHRAKVSVSDSELHDIRRTLIYRHVAYINALRLQLRQPNSFSLKHPKTVRGLLNKNKGGDWEDSVASF